MFFTTKDAKSTKGRKKNKLDVPNRGLTIPGRHKAHVRFHGVRDVVQGGDSRVRADSWMLTFFYHEGHEEHEGIEKDVHRVEKEGPLGTAPTQFSWW